MFLQILTISFLFNFIFGNELKLSANSLPPLLRISSSELDLKFSGPIGQFIEQLARDFKLKIFLTDKDDSDIFINIPGNGKYF